MVIADLRFLSSSDRQSSCTKNWPQMPEDSKIAAACFVGALKVALCVEAFSFRQA